MCSSLECSEVYTIGGARMVEEVGELELGHGLPEGKLQDPFYNVRMNECVLDQSWIPQMGALAALISSSGLGYIQRRRFS